MKNVIVVTEANYRSAVLDAAQPVLVEFGADGCESCKMLAPLLAEIAAESAGRIIFAKINVEENPALAKQHHIQSLPTLLFFYQGLVMDQLIGTGSKKDILTILEKLRPGRANPPGISKVTPIA
jgi:thioredoxin 1